MILASGLCVDADVTAALSTPDTVNEPFQAQMQCFLTIWYTLQCRVLQMRDGLEFRNTEPRLRETYLEEPSKLPQFSWLLGIMFSFVCHSFIHLITTRSYGAAAMRQALGIQRWIKHCPWLPETELSHGGHGNQPYDDIILSSVIQEVIKDPGNSKELVKIFAMEFKNLFCTPASECFSLFRRTPQIGKG